MNKVIEKCEAYKEKTVSAAIEKAKAAYAEADACYRDTGYDRYYNKMNKFGKEIEELEEYAKSGEAVAEARREKEKVRHELEEIKKTLKNKIFYLLKAIPECSEGRSLEAYIDKL
jgi:hypothetical protein